jgi:5-methylcytosine-specific restriction enzyme subunit McrC
VDVLQATILNGKHAFKAAQHVGVFRFDNTTVQILPKIYRSSSTGSRQGNEQVASRNLLYLLNYALHLPIREFPIAPLGEQSQDWFELLISLFTKHLMEEWQRGPYLQYQEIDDELPVLKGKWRINDQLRHPERKHTFAVSYDEFVVDIPLNRVFRFVVERLWRITRNAHTRDQLESLRQWMEDITLLHTMTLADTATIVITRLNQRFAPLLELARLFLDKSALQLTAGETSTFSFVIDMNQLFESFLANFICRHRDDILPPFLQVCELLPQSQSAPYYLATHIDTGKAVYRLKPDLAFYNKTINHFPLLLDMKYKQLTNSTITSDISQDDFYQMYAYAHRYQCPCVLLLYPQTAELSEPLSRRFALTGSEKAIIAVTVDIRGDLSRKEEQQKLKDRLKNILTSEGNL